MKLRVTHGIDLVFPVLRNNKREKVTNRQINNTETHLRHFFAHIHSHSMSIRCLLDTSGTFSLLVFDFDTTTPPGVSYLLGCWTTFQHRHLDAQKEER